MDSQRNYEKQQILDHFKSKIRSWKSDCPSRLCKTDLQHFGSIKISLCLSIWSVSV